MACKLKVGKMQCSKLCVCAFASTLTAVIHFLPKHRLQCVSEEALLIRKVGLKAETHHTQVHSFRHLVCFSPRCLTLHCTRQKTLHRLNVDKVSYLLSQGV